MLIFDQLKRDDRELRFLAIVMFVGLSVLSSGLWYIQIVRSRHYQENQIGQTTRTVRVPAVRGKILDRNGIPMARNRPVFNLDIYLADLSSRFKASYKVVKKQQPELTNGIPSYSRLARYLVVSNLAARVSNWLHEEITIDEAEFNKHFSTKRALPYPILKNLSLEQVALFSEKPQSLPGLDLRVQSVRVYPYESLGAHMLGMLKRDESSHNDEDAYFDYRLPDWQGLAGIEGEYDSQLRGLAGTRRITVNYLSYQTTNSFLRTPDPGASVTLTIDLRLQHAAEAALRQTEFGNDVRGSVVILDPRNGDLLALASAPTYDPHIFLGRISNEVWRNLNNSTNRPQLNRSIYEHYHPGSVFKMITTLAALEAGQCNPAEEIYNPGYWQWREGSREIDDTAAAGMYDLRRAFVRSSNTYFIRHAMKKGVIQKMVMLGEKLGLGQKSRLIRGQDVAGNYPKLDDLVSSWGPGNTANLAIGQGRIHVTPLQVATMTAAIANGGIVFWPRIAARVEPNDPESTVRATYFKQGNVRSYLGASPHNLQILKSIMRADVHDRDGTGKAALTPGITIGGKTGTAEVEKNGKIVDKITWFASFAPVETPRYVVVVMVESGKSGGYTCAPVAGLIYQEIVKIEQQARQNTLAITQ